MGAEKERKKVEITPEMIEAGLRIYLGFDARFDSPENLIPRIFTAMVEASATEGGSRKTDYTQP